MEPADVGRIGALGVLAILADERRTAWVRLAIGLAYNWRDLGDQYTTDALGP
jgi:hypothetical protein